MNSGLETYAVLSQFLDVLIEGFNLLLVALLDLFSLNLKICYHLLLFRELVLDEWAECLSLFFEASLQFDEALFVLDVKRLPEQVCDESVHKAGLVLQVCDKSSEFLMNVHHLIIDEVEFASTSPEVDSPISHWGSHKSSLCLQGIVPRTDLIRCIQNRYAIVEVRGLRVGLHNVSEKFMHILE